MKAFNKPFWIKSKHKATQIMFYRWDNDETSFNSGEMRYYQPMNYYVEAKPDYDCPYFFEDIGSLMNFCEDHGIYLENDYTA
jgi:hypothetical protein